jgi:hypothetical protein
LRPNPKRLLPWQQRDNVITSAPEREMDVAYRMTACRLPAGFFAAVRQASATWRATRLHAVVVGAALALGCPLHAEESFLFPTEAVSAWSLGAVARPSTYVWADPISLGIPASGDPRIPAYLIGAITTQARFLNVQMLARPEHNFWIYTDRQFAADFLKGEGPQFFEAYGLPPETAKVIFDRTVGIIAGGIVRYLSDSQSDGTAEATSGGQSLPVRERRISRLRRDNHASGLWRKHSRPTIQPQCCLPVPN